MLRTRFSFFFRLRCWGFLIFFGLFRWIWTWTLAMITASWWYRSLWCFFLMNSLFYRRMSLGCLLGSIGLLNVLPWWFFGKIFPMIARIRPWLCLCLWTGQDMHNCRFRVDLQLLVVFFMSIFCMTSGTKTDTNFCDLAVDTIFGQDLICIDEQNSIFINLFMPCQMFQDL